MDTANTPQPAASLSPPAEARAPLTPAGIFWYSLANLGYGAFFAFNNFVIPAWLQTYTQQPFLLGLMGSSHSFEGAIIQPIVGSVSDRLPGPGGRRRPFMRLFILISALFLLLAPAAALLPSTVRLGAVIVCIFAFTLTFNVALDPYQALLADITTPEQRGRVTGFWYFVGAFGQVAFLLLPLALPLPDNVRFGLLAALMLGTTLLTCAKTQEPPAILPPEGKRGPWSDIGLALQGLRTLHQARIYMAMFFLYGAGVDAVVPFLTLFIQKITGCPIRIAEMMPALLLVMTAVGSLAFGPLADKLGPKRLLGLSMAVIAVAAGNALWVHSLLQVAAVLSLAGLGIGAQNASAYPLLTSNRPAQRNRLLCRLADSRLLGGRSGRAGGDQFYHQPPAP